MLLARQCCSVPLSHMQQSLNFNFSSVSNHECVLRGFLATCHVGERVAYTIGAKACSVSQFK